MKLFKSFCLPLIACLSISASAQIIVIEPPPDSLANKPAYFYAGAQYVSNLTYAGRNDLSTSPLVAFSATGMAKFGLFVNVIDYIDLRKAGAESQGLNVSPGYYHWFDSDKKFLGLVYFRYDITNQNQTILSSFNAGLNGELIYTTGSLRFIFNEIYNIELNNDHDNINILSAEEKLWLLKTGISNGFQIMPKVSLYAGSQLFTETYFANSNAAAIGLSELHQARQYQLLAISGTLPVAYVLNGWNFNFIPSLVQPFNQINYSKSKQNANPAYFYFSVGAYVVF